MNKYILNCQTQNKNIVKSLPKETKERLSEALSNELFELFDTQEEFSWAELECIVQKEGVDLLAHAHSRLLEKLDDKLCAEKSDEWTVAKKERVKKVSLTGELSYEKRIYRHKDIGISRCLLDELVKATRRSRATPAFSEMAARIACDLSFQKTADILEAFSKSCVSKSAIKEFVARAEAPLEKNDIEQVRNFLVLGEKPQGKISAPVLYIESDATYLASQESDKKNIRVHTACFYAGKKRENKKERREHVLRFSGTGSVEAFRAKAVAEALSVFDIATIQCVRVGFDGEKCYQCWKEYFPSRIRFEDNLDPYHLFKIVESCFERENPKAQAGKQDVFELLREGHPQAAADYLETLVNRGFARYKANLDVAQYIRNNAFAIRKTDYSLGTIETDQQHIVSARMKSVPCGWSKEGAHAVLRLQTRISSGLPLPEPDWKRSYTTKELRAIQEKIDNYYTRSWDKSVNCRTGETEFRCQGTISNTNVRKAVQDFFPDF